MDQAIEALLPSAVEGPNWQWLLGVLQLHERALTPSALHAAGLPPELAGDCRKVESYISQLHESKAAGVKASARSTLIVVGHEGGGKSSLVWRLQHPAGDMPELSSTNGVDTGTALELLYKQRAATTATLTARCTVLCCAVLCCAANAGSWKLVPPAGVSVDAGAGDGVMLRTVDLGGQATYYATHPCFFSCRAVYLLCWSGREMDGSGGPDTSPGHTKLGAIGPDGDSPSPRVAHSGCSDQVRW